VRTEIVTGVEGVPAGATVWRILYLSRSIYNAPIAVSGYVIVPPGSPPAGGWNVLSWAHGTTGVTPACDPSRFPTGGTNHPYLLPDLQAFLTAGYLVTATDYEGLGGLQPYLLGESEGRGVLDAARAAHRLPGVPVSATTLIYGHSQGGHAALFTGELAVSYAPDLRVVGVVAAAPATNLSLIVSLAATPAGQGALSYEVEAGWTWVHTYRDLPASALFTAKGIAAAPSLVAGCLDDTDAAIARGHVQAADLFQAGIATDPVVTAHAQRNDPGRVRTTAPILVVQGTVDRTVPQGLTDGYVQKMACPVGDTIDYLRFEGATHDTIPIVAADRILAWMVDRVMGRTAATTCGMPDDASSVAAGSS
jgi:alpha-beta hydrolase superfamily lysophospholipase